MDLKENSEVIDTPSEKLNKLNVPRYIAWVLYDIANTFYAAGILTLSAQTWILVAGQQTGLLYADANFYYNFTLSVGSLFMALMLPVLGSLSDVTQQRKSFVLLFSFICIASTFAFSIANSFGLVLLFFAISMISYQWAQVFYDAMLPGIAPPGREARLSSIAIALGYLGGGAIILYSNILSSSFPDPNANPSRGIISLGYFPYLIIAVIIGFGLLSLPLLFVNETNWEVVSGIVEEEFPDEVPSDNDNNFKTSSTWSIIKNSFTELWDTLQDIATNNKAMLFYIIAYFIIADIANLIVVINTEYMRSVIGLSDTTITLVFAVTGMSLILLTYPIGIVNDKFGAKRGFQLVGVLWLFALSLLLLEDIIFEQGIIFIAGVFLGPALSGVWVCQRQMVLELVPDEKSVGRYFGLTKFSGKLSSAIGPIIFGASLIFFRRGLGTTLSGSWKWSIFVLTIILIIGFAILHFKVPSKHKEFVERKKKMVAALERQT